MARKWLWDVNVFFFPLFFLGGFLFFEVVIPVVTSEIALTTLTA